MGLREKRNNIAIRAIKIYQYFSAYTQKSCRYYPTCSEYTIEYINKYGTVKGIIAGLGRILRCNPLFKGGYDPVK